MAIDRGPWNVLVDDDGSNLVGSVWNKAAIKTVVLDPVDAAIPTAPTLQTFTPNWRSNGVSIVIGNGTVIGEYQVLSGGLVWFHVKLSFGSTTQIQNTGGWVVNLPVVLSEGLVTFQGTAYNGAGTWLVTTHSIAQAQAANLMLPTSPQSAVTNTAPFTWLAGHVLDLQGVYR